jgi:hypothetical protein
MLLSTTRPPGDANAPSSRPVAYSQNSPNNPASPFEGVTTTSAPPRTDGRARRWCMLKVCVFITAGPSTKLWSFYHLPTCTVCTTNRLVFVFCSRMMILSADSAPPLISHREEGLVKMESGHGRCEQLDSGFYGIKFA